jgi:hypothetical protein
VIAQKKHPQLAKKIRGPLMEKNFAREKFSLKSDRPKKTPEMGIPLIP